MGRRHNKNYIKTKIGSCSKIENIFNNKQKKQNKVFDTDLDDFNSDPNNDIDPYNNERGAKMEAPWKGAFHNFYHNNILKRFQKPPKLYIL